MLLVAATSQPAHAVRWPWESDPWPKSSTEAVTPLEHPPVEEWLAGHDVSRPYRFAVFGDQRALADGEWQELVAGVAAAHAQADVAFVLDTGDIVNDGRYGDQFGMLREILSPVSELPYLVTYGNHEARNNRARSAREHSAVFLRAMDPQVSPDRFYYRKDLGAATFLFLDTNDLVYGEDGKRKGCPAEIDPQTRSGQQLRWLTAELEGLAADPPPLTIVGMHHPPVQSSRKHFPVACSVWNVHWEGRRLVDLLADGGVDVILTGHTHTYERFGLVRKDGHRIDVVNLSGRPRDSFLWVGASERRARDLRGRENDFFAGEGWEEVGERWGVLQEDAMVEDEANQFALFTVEPDGGLVMEVRFLDDDEPGGFRVNAPVRLR